MKKASVDLDILYFLAETPSAWVQFSPIWIYDNKIYFDRHLLFTYTAIFIVAVLTWTFI